MAGEKNQFIMGLEKSERLPRKVPPQWQENFTPGDYTQYCRHVPTDQLYDLFNMKPQAIIGRAIDILFVITTLGGLSVTLGLGVLQNYLKILMWTDPVENSGFSEAWIIFYICLAVAYALMSLFITEISNGRTIKEMMMSTALRCCDLGRQ